MGELIEIKHGFAFKGEYFVDYPTGDVLVTPGNFAIGGGFKSDKLKYYDGPVVPEYVLRPGSLIVTMTDLSKQADTLGYSAVVPQHGPRFLHNQRIGLVTSRDDEVGVDFLGWLMRTPTYRSCVVGSATGSTVKHTSPSRIKEFEFLLPPRKEREAIASLLNALDDKIELNRRMNETLESQARALFRDWFVDFGPVKAKMAGAAPYLAPELWSLFPDRLNDDGVPEKWRWDNLDQVIHFNPREKLTPGTESPYLEMASLPTRGSCADTAILRAFGSGSKFRNGDALLARITPCLENGKTAYVDGLADGIVGWGSTEFIVMRSKPPVPPQVAYLVARDPDFRATAIQSMSGTSGRQRASVDALSCYQVAVPANLGIWEAMARLLGPIFEKIRANALESRTLVQTRDLLLPKLMSGEIRVGDSAAVGRPA